MGMSHLQNNFKNFDSGSIGEEIEGIIRARFRGGLNPGMAHARVSRFG